MTSAPTAAVEVQAWQADYPPYTVGGSIYAVPASHRIVAARALVANQCRVHADVILGGIGEHRGVTLKELSDIRRSVPTALIDVHLITLGGRYQAEIGAEEERVLDAVADLGAVAITLSPAQISRHYNRLTPLRTAGTHVWVEVSPATSALAGDTGLMDGALVMFIEPGTKDSADVRHLAKVADLSPTGPVAVDGGITRTIASHCRRHGASYLVSGRDLLSATTDTHPIEQVPAIPKGAQP